MDLWIKLGGQKGGHVVDMAPYKVENESAWHCLLVSLVSPLHCKNTRTLDPLRNKSQSLDRELNQGKVGGAIRTQVSIHTSPESVRECKWQAYVS